MGEWKEYALGDVVDIGSSKRIFYEDYVAEGVPFYRSKEVIERAKSNSVSTELFITEEKFQEISKRYGSPMEGDLLLTSVGTLGVPYVVGKGERFYFKDGNLTWFQSFKRELSNRFLLYWFGSPIGRSELDMASIGSTQAALTIQGLKKLVLCLPEPAEQESIVAVLSSLDAKIDLLHRQNKTLEAVAETLFRQWFVERRPEDLEGEAEEGWEEVPLGEFGTIVCGKTPSKKIHDYHNGSIPFIRIPDMHGQVYLNYSSDSITEKGQASQSNKTLPLGSICVSCIATVGLVSITTRECQTNQQINSIIPSKEHYRYYLYLLMLNLYEDLHAMASGGTATLNLNTSNFKSMLVSAPPDKVLRDFHQVVAPLFGRMRHNYDQLTTLTNLRDTLLPKLMSGEVRVEFKQ